MAGLIGARGLSGPGGGYLVLVELHQVVRRGDQSPFGARAADLPRRWKRSIRLLRAGELTASRLLNLHNLAYTQALMAALREAIGEGRLAAAVAASRACAAPWELA